jgi:hypothetical protein
MPPHCINITCPSDNSNDASPTIHSFITYPEAMDGSNMNQSVTLMDHFPRVASSCKDPAHTFFQCFSQKSLKENNNDTMAGQRGLRTCIDGKHYVIDMYIVVYVNHLVIPNLMNSKYSYLCIQHCCVSWILFIYREESIRFLHVRLGKEVWPCEAIPSEWLGIWYLIWCTYC